MKNRIHSLVAVTILLALSNQTLGQQSVPSDELKISVQEICPVSGAELGSKGKPLKIQFGDETAFLCCQNCVGKQVKGEHWKQVQTNLAAAQKQCPIMDKPVESTMQATVVAGQKIFVCCPPCIEKIQANPARALRKVTANLEAYVNQRASRHSEQLNISVQAICPVSGDRLGSMGKPVKVKVGKEYLYVCCKKCLSGKINVKHWKSIQANLAKAQAVCPVMEQPVDASMKYAIVKGRKIFVCCPPCIEKIEAQPETYVAELNRLYLKSSSTIIK